MFVFAGLFELYSSFYGRCVREKCARCLNVWGRGPGGTGRVLDCAVSIVPRRSEQMRGARVGKVNTRETAPRRTGRSDDIYIRDFDRRLPLVGRAENDASATTLSR